MSSNSLEAVLRAESKKNEAKVVEKPAVKKTTVKRRTVKPKKDTEGKEATVMIGGHFSKAISRQLRLIAAEEDKTNLALLEEALNLLFVKKGKKKIKDLVR